MHTRMFPRSRVSSVFDLEESLGGVHDSFGGWFARCTFGL